MPDFFDFDGSPISHEEWIMLFHGDRHVAITSVGDVEISTVFVGLDYSFGQGVPLIYETMIFGGAHDRDQWRTPNRHAALAAHDQAVALVRETSQAAR